MRSHSRIALFGQTLRQQRTRRFGFILIFSFLVFSGAICKNNIPAPDPVELQVWRSEDSSEDFSSIINAYQAQYPYVDVKVKVFKKEEYEDAIKDAWVKGEGPDIFSVPNIRLGKFQEFSAPMPSSVKLKVYSKQKGMFSTKTVIQEKAVSFPVASQLRSIYVDAVPADVVFDEQIYGLPMSFDTLSLFYNYDLLAKAGIAVPPKTMQDFVNAVQTMTVRDTKRNIVQPGAAIGTAENVPYYFDILSAIMMQNGTVMTNERNQVLFNREDTNKQIPGARALDFYAAFSNPAVSPYTWNAQQPDALEAFTQGTLGFYFGYYGDKEAIEQRAPNLNFSYTTFPQVDPSNPITIAQYPVESVFVNSPNKDHAWNFIHFATSEEQVQTFLTSSGRLPARKTLVSEQQRDPVLGVYAKQALTAKSWYHGVDPDAAIQAFKEMIDQANQRTIPLEDVISISAQKVNLTMKK